MGRTRIFAPAMAVLLAIGGSIAAAPIPALAECTGPDQWPRFRDGAASASVVVTGTVHDVAFDPRNPDRVAHFRLDVDRELRGHAAPSLSFPGILTSRGCIPWGIQVRDGDRIVVALGPARTGIPGVVASVAFLSPVRRAGFTPGVERMTLRHIRQTLELPSADLVLFTADDGRHGRELWRTDGRGEHTRLVKDIRPQGASDPQDLVAAGGLLWFSADDGVHGRELWVSDGTADGTRMAMDIRPGSASSNPRWMTGTYGGDVWFAADDGIHGRELWAWEASRGTARLRQDLRPQGGSAPGSAPRGLIESNGSVVFSADDGVHGRELWSSESYADDPAVLTDLRPGPASSDPADLVELGARYAEVVAMTADDGTHGREPFAGDRGGTDVRLVADLVPGSVGSDPDAIASRGAQGWFVARDEVGPQVWSLRTRQAPVAVTVLAPTSDGRPATVTGIATLSRGLAIFGATDGDDGGRLWTSDGTPDGTRPIDGVPAGLAPGEVLATQGRAFVVAAGPGADGRELWVTRGTPDSTRAIADLDPDGDAAPHDLVGYHGDAVFVADDGRTGDEPWVSTGHAGGTRRVLDIHPGPQGSDPRDLTVVTWERERYDTLG